METKNKFINKNTLAIFVCWLVYACSYIGKLGYNANITQIESEFGITHAESGSVGTIFFFAYGAGQIINGIFCKKYNLKYTVFFSLLISSVCNFVLPFLNKFAYFKYIWLINGASLSFLWAMLARFLSGYLDKNYVSKAVVVMGTTVACGTFAVYGLSALFVKLSAYKTIFFVAAAILPIVAFVWFFMYLFLKKADGGLQKTGEEVSAETPQEKTNGKQLITMFIVLGAFAVITNLIKDGITVWVPTMLKEIYVMPDYLGILLTLCLPLVSVFGTAVAVFTGKYIKGFIPLCGVMFLASALAIGAEMIFGATSAAVMIICLCVVSLVMSGSNNVITSMAPLTVKTANAGMLAGLMNGCSYIGSTISSYGLGTIADNFGWSGVFRLLFIASLICVGTSAVFGLVSRFAGKNK